MSTIKISDYVFFLKTCYFGHRLLEKCYKMQQVYLALLLEDKQPASLVDALQVFNTLIEQALLSMNPCYLSFLADRMIEQQASALRTFIPLWDYTLVLNDQHNLHTFLSQKDLDIKGCLQRIEVFYQYNPRATGVVFVEQLKKLQSVAQFIHQKMLVALENTQAFLDKTPLKSDTGCMGAFEAFMRHLK
nr:hypothetical protein [Gammaproteobacteria bacterium]